MLEDILEEVLLILGQFERREKLRGISQKSTFEQEIKDFAEHDKNDLILMKSLALSVVNSITRNYIKNIHVEKVKTDAEGKIFFDALEKQIISVKDVVDSLNSPVVFNVYFDHVKTAIKNKDLMISYFFECEDLDSLFDEFSLPLSLTNHIVALGVASEYLSSKLLFAEASVMEQKFKSELEDARQKRGSRIMPVWRN